MSQRSYAFEPPGWRPFRRLPLSTGQLLLASAVWLLIYCWLGYRVWVAGLHHGFWLNLILALFCVALGATVALGWRNTGSHWARRVWSAVGGAHRNLLTVEQMRQLTPSEFEAFVASYFVRQGYQVVNVRDTKDNGVDVLLTDQHGQQTVVQCKRYRGNVGEPIVRDLYGTMIHTGAAHAYLITTAGFSSEAKRWALGKPITLVDGPGLVALLEAEVE